MGGSFPSTYAAFKCFNGQKLWAFNWWPSKKKSVDPIANGAWKGRLAAFVDVSMTSMPVVLRVGNLYLVYNRAKKHNSQTYENKNRVTIVKGSSSTSISHMKAGIGDASGEKSFSGDAVFDQGTFSVTIEVCKVVRGVGAVDYVELSIRRKSTASTCGNARSLFVGGPGDVNSTLVAPGQPCKLDSDCSGIDTFCAPVSAGGVCQSSEAAKTSNRRREQLRNRKQFVLP